MSQRVLIVDDEKTFRMVCTTALVAEGYEVLDAANGRAALVKFTEANPDVIILDRNLPDIDGLKLLEKFRQEAQANEERGEPIVIMATAYAEVENAVQALKAGAYDYLTKPLQLPELVVTVQKALEARKLRKAVQAMQGEVARRMARTVHMGTSAAMKTVVSMVDKVALSSSTTVLIDGESGSGKEVIAHLIHHKTPSRSDQPFVELNCASIPEALMESELFGHVKGAFTDAKGDKRGLMEAADGGTLFLDEIGEMPLAIQAKLLRVLETSQFRRVGATRDQQVDVRFVAATNRDLAREVEKGTFRLDLYHRLDVFRLRLPPLRERRDDVLPLARAFLQEFCGKMGKQIASLSSEAEATLLAYPFPGNIRELRNAIERAVILEMGTSLGADSLLLGNQKKSQHPASWAGETMDKVLAEQARPPTLDELERDYIVRLLEHAHGNRSQVARLMGVSYPTVMKKITDYNIDISRWVKG
jgi:DNA-binding NtrC family response regulator